jgi:hypothetical protein
VIVNHADFDLNSALQRFWEIAEVATTRLFTPEEQLAEEHFVFTHIRLASGQYLVKLPWRSPRPTVSSSREIALRRHRQLEKRLGNNPEHYKEYSIFMREYRNINHMSLIEEQIVLTCRVPSYYIPHHFVVKNDSTTTKFRVVFDSST